MKEINRLNDLFVRYLIGTEGDEDIRHRNRFSARYGKRYRKREIFID